MQTIPWKLPRRLPRVQINRPVYMDYGHNIISSTQASIPTKSADQKITLTGYWSFVFSSRNFLLLLSRQRLDRSPRVGKALAEGCLAWNDMRRASEDLGGYGVGWVIWLY